MDEESHWDRIASNYNKEIFDVFKSDRKQILPQYFDKHANEKHHAMDFGCGTGKAFSYLSPRFKDIVALDISAKCLAIAKQNPYKNISFKRMDLSKPNLILPVSDFIFCCNVIMLPKVVKNEIMIRNIQMALREGGHAVIVLPSFDSILFSTWRLIDWYRKEGVPPDKIPAAELNYFRGSKLDILQGVVRIDSVKTKHYSQSELEVLIRRAGLELTAIEKLEYEWSTEFAEPADWMREPYPWDWLIECRKIKAV